VELVLNRSELDLVDADAIAACYEQQIREQQSQLQKEDLPDMLADHVARQKNKREQCQDNKQSKMLKEFKFKYGVQNILNSRCIMYFGHGLCAENVCSHSKSFSRAVGCLRLSYKLGSCRRV
jgi:hypothetical protein